MKVTLIPECMVHTLWEEDEEGLRDLQFEECREIGDLYCQILHDAKRNEYIAYETSPCVHMGFNSNDEGAVDKFLSNMKKYGHCKASWGVTGRTAHEILAHKLAAEFPQYRFVIGYNYECEAFDDYRMDRRMVPMAGFVPEYEI